MAMGQVDTLGTTTDTWGLRCPKHLAELMPIGPKTDYVREWHLLKFGEGEGSAGGRGSDGGGKF